MEIHPTFDLATGTWFVDGAEAHTISALLAKMPSGTRARDYYPGGYAVSAEDRGFSINDLRYAKETPRLRQQLSGEAAALSRPKHVNRRVIDPRNSKYDHEAVLNMWSTGTSGTLISQRLGISKTAVQYVVSCGRVRKDVRAVRRGGERREALYA